MNTTTDTIEILNNLIEASKDGEYGFQACAKQAESANLKSLLAARAAECRTAATELQARVAELGGSPDTGGSAVGAMHRGWVAIKSKLSTHDDLAVLEECERGEDSALKSYRAALEEDLPQTIRDLVERQFQGVKRNHDEIRRLRNSMRQSS